MNENPVFGNSYCGFDARRVPWTLLPPQMTADMLGYIPEFLIADDPRSAREQFNDRYAMIGGGGWHRTAARGLVMKDDGLHFPGDPVMVLLAEAKLRDETIRFYNRSWVSITQPDGSYEIARMD